MRGEALEPVKAHCPSVGECQGREAGVGELLSSGGGDGTEGDWSVNEDITFEMQIKISNEKS